MSFLRPQVIEFEKRVKKYLKLLRGKHWKPVAAECLYLLSDSEWWLQGEGIPSL